MLLAKVHVLFIFSTVSSKALFLILNPTFSWLLCLCQLVWWPCIWWPCRLWWALGRHFIEYPLFKTCLRLCYNQTRFPGLEKPQQQSAVLPTGRFITGSVGLGHMAGGLFAPLWSSVPTLHTAVPKTHSLCVACLYLMNLELSFTFWWQRIYINNLKFLFVGCYIITYLFSSSLIA